MDAILNGLYTAVSWVLVTFHDLLAFTNNPDLQWVVGIIALVILIRIILIPLFVKQIKSQRALTALQPHMKAIQKKYKKSKLIDQPQFYLQNMEIDLEADALQ